MCGARGAAGIHTFSAVNPMKIRLEVTFVGPDGFTKFPDTCRACAERIAYSAFHNDH